MNFEETKKAIEVMQAFVDGKEIQCRESSTKWESTSTPLWLWDDFYYRIKPEPKEIWVNEWKGRYFDVCATQDEAIDKASSKTGDPLRTAVRFREVIEE